MKLSLFAVMVCVVASFGTSALAIDVGGAPYISDRVKREIERDYERSSEACQVSYTVAISPEGHWSARCHRRATLDDVVRMTMEKCEHIAQRPCGAIIIGGLEVQYFTRRPFIRYPETFDAMRVPFVRRASRVELRETFAKADGHKALAITRNGTWGSSVTADSSEAAIEAALADCEEFDRNRNRCFLYSVDGVVRFNHRTNIYPDR